MTMMVDAVIISVIYRFFHLISFGRSPGNLQKRSVYGKFSHKKIKWKILYFTRCIIIFNLETWVIFLELDTKKEFIYQILLSVIFSTRCKLMEILLYYFGNLKSEIKLLIKFIKYCWSCNISKQQLTELWKK